MMLDVAYVVDLVLQLGQLVPGEATVLGIKVELVNRGRVRRGKLYYLRALRGNAARIRTKLGSYASALAPKEPEAAEAVKQDAPADGK